MSSVDNQDMAHSVQPSLTETFRRATGQTRSDAHGQPASQEQTIASVHYRPSEGEDSGAQIITSSKFSASKSCEGDPSSTNHQSQTGKTEDESSEESDEYTVRTPLASSSIHLQTVSSHQPNKKTAAKKGRSIEEAEGGNTEQSGTFKDDEVGAPGNSEKPRKESDKNPDEKQPVNKESICRVRGTKWKIIICGSVTLAILFALVGVAGFVIAVSQISRESTDGAWSHWGKWTECSVTCGNGIHHRSRNCHGGRYCAGHPLEYQMCPIKPCPATDGAWSPWGNWTECSVTCGKGIHHRSRNCSDPVPSHGGRYCAGPPLEYQMCTIQPCPVSFPAFTAFNPKQIQSERLQSWELLDHFGSDFNSTTGTFTCSVAGIYLFSLTLVKKGTGTNPVAKVHCHLYKNNNQFMSLILNPSYNIGNDAISSTAIMRLKEGDRVYLGQCTDPESTLEKWTSFTGVLQSRD